MLRVLLIRSKLQQTAVAALPRARLGVWNGRRRVWAAFGHPRFEEEPSASVV